MKQNLRKTISMMLALALFMIIPALAVDAQIQKDVEINYVYLESSEQIPWGNIPANTAYIVPNENASNKEFPNENVLLGNATVQRRDAWRPTDEWNIATKGRYTIIGSDLNESNGTILYTSYYFTGKTAYSIVITNEHTQAFDVNIYTRADNEIFKEYTVNAGSTLYCFIERNDGFTTSTQWYLGFTDPCIVRGTVSGNY